MTYIGARKALLSRPVVAAAGVTSTVTPLFLSTNTSGPSTLAARHNSLVGGQLVNGWVSVPAQAGTPWPLAGKFRDLAVRYPTPLPADATKKYDVALAIGSTAQALTVPITDAAILGNDNTHEVIVAPGDLISYISTPTNTPQSQTSVQISSVFVPDDLTKTVGLGRHLASSAAGPFYLPLQSIGLDTTSTEEAGSTLMPFAGTIDSLFTNLSGARGSGVTCTYTVRLNGVDQALTTSYTAAESGVKSDSTGGFAFAAGDRISISAVASGAGGAAVACCFSVAITPTVAGDVLMPLVANTNLTTTADRYLNASGAAGGGGSTEELVYIIAPIAMTIAGMRGRLSDAPGATKSRTISFRANAGSPGGAPTLAFGATDFSLVDPSNTATLAKNDLFNLRHSSVNTPTSTTWAQVSMTGRAV